MVPCVDDATADMFALRSCFLWAGGLLDVDRQLSLGPNSVSIARYIAVVPHVYYREAVP